MGADPDNFFSMGEGEAAVFPEGFPTPLCFRLKTAIILPKIGDAKITRCVEGITAQIYVSGGNRSGT